MSVRGKFMRVRSLWKLCARVHPHSLEGALVPAYGYGAPFTSNLRRSRFFNKIDLWQYFSNIRIGIGTHLLY